MTTVMLDEFVRKTITPAEQAQITNRLMRFGLMSDSARSRLCVKLLSYNAMLETEVDEMRTQRGYLSTTLDDQLVAINRRRDLLMKQEAWRELFKLLMEENIKLTHENNVHRRALGKPELKTFED